MASSPILSELKRKQWISSTYIAPSKSFSASNLLPAFLSSSADMLVGSCTFNFVTN